MPISSKVLNIKAPIVLFSFRRDKKIWSPDEENLSTYIVQANSKINKS